MKALTLAPLLALAALTSRTPARADGRYDHGTSHGYSARATPTTAATATTVVPTAAATIGTTGATTTGATASYGHGGVLRLPVLRPYSDYGYDPYYDYGYVPAAAAAAPVLLAPPAVGVYFGF